MALIDDDGNLFGVLNVIDALAIVLLLAVVVAGIAFVGVLGADGEPESRYATIDLGEQPEYVIERVGEGDRMVAEAHGHNLTVTDVHVSAPAEEDGDPHLTVRAQVGGERVFDEARGEEVFRFAGERLRIGQEIELDTLDYEADGEVIAVDPDGESLVTAETPVVLEATTTASTAAEIAEGDSYRLGGHELATVRSVTTYPIGDDERYVLVEAGLSTVERDGSPTFAGRSLTLGTTVPLETGTYALDGEVVQRGDGPDGAPTIEETPAVLEATTTATTAAEIEEGDEYRLGGETVGTVRSVATYPTGADQRRVLVGVDLLTLEEDGSPTFLGEGLSLGSTVPFETDGYDLEGELLRRGSLEEPGEPTTTVAQVELEDVPPSVADGLAAGMTETERGETLATIEAVESEPADVVLESEDGDIFLREHPKNRDVTLTVELATRETETGLRFHGDSLREGDTITLDVGPRLVEGEVTVLER